MGLFDSPANAGYLIRGPLLLIFGLALFIPVMLGIPVESPGFEFGIFLMAVGVLQFAVAFIQAKKVGIKGDDEMSVKWRRWLGARHGEIR